MVHVLPFSGMNVYQGASCNKWDSYNGINSEFWTTEESDHLNTWRIKYRQLGFSCHVAYKNCPAVYWQGRVLTKWKLQCQLISTSSGDLWQYGFFPPPSWRTCLDGTDIWIIKCAMTELGRHPCLCDVATFHCRGRGPANIAYRPGLHSGIFGRPRRLRSDSASVLEEID